jgi:uncharacterized protein YbjT (DUF2867 family)
LSGREGLIAVTGATGFVGQALLEAAAQLGLEVRALARKRQVPRLGVEWIPGDLSNRAVLDRLVQGASAVIHIAGVVNAPLAADFEAGNVGGTLNLVEAARAEGVPRFIHVSSLSAREPQLSEYGASKARGERMVMASGLDWTVVRPPWVYGPRDSDTLEMFRMARWGVVPVPSGRASIIHVNDLARLLLALLPSGEEVTHKVFEPDDGRPNGWTHRELACGIGWALGKRPWVPELSKVALTRVSRIERMFRGDKARLTLDRVGYMTHPDWVVGAGAAVPPNLWTPQVRTGEGLKATAAWYRQQKWL